MKQAPRFFCDNCGHEVGTNEKACSYCGRLFTSVRCPACGHSGEEKFFINGCPECGYSADPAAPAVSPSMVKKKKIKKKKAKKPPPEPLPPWAYIVLTAAVFIFVALLSHFITS